MYPGGTKRRGEDGAQNFHDEANKESGDATGGPRPRAAARRYSEKSRTKRRCEARMEDIERIGNVTRAGVTALSLGNLQAVGIAMNECHRLLQGIGVSDADLDRMVEAALPTSLGAKLTGAGGGGCMIALTMEPRRTAEAIELAGGRTMVSQLGAPGVRIETID